MSSPAPSARFSSFVRAFVKTYFSSSLIKGFTSIAVLLASAFLILGQYEAYYNCVEGTGR